jgi:hypothetical protein
VSTLYGLAEVLGIDPAMLIDLAVHQDAELVKRLNFGMKWKDEEYDWCYQRYPQYARLKNVEVGT